jgi:hypothetical protein
MERGYHNGVWIGIESDKRIARTIRGIKTKLRMIQAPHSLAQPHRVHLSHIFHLPRTHPPEHTKNMRRRSKKGRTTTNMHRSSDEGEFMLDTMSVWNRSGVRAHDISETRSTIGSVDECVCVGDGALCSQPRTPQTTSGGKWVGVGGGGGGY